MRSFAAVCTLIAALPLHAARFTVTFDGDAVAGAEVCVFSAGTTTSALGRWFPPSAVACHAAGENIALPAGDWNAVARRGTELVSEGALLISSDGGRGGSHELRVVRAARVRVQPAPGNERALFAYVPRTRSTIPISEGWGIPAGTTVVPVSVSAGGVIAVGAPVTGAAGETVVIEPPAPRSGRIDVVAPYAFRIVPEGRVDPPDVIAIDGAGKRHAAVDPLRIAERGATGLLFFRQLPKGSVKVAVQGQRWKSEQATVSLAEGESVAVLEKPLPVVASSKLLVHWWTRVPLMTLRPAAAECAAPHDPMTRPPSTDVKSFTATHFHCADAQGRSAMNLSQCTEAGTRELPADAVNGTLEFEDVAAGLHYIRFEAPGLPPISQRAEVLSRDITTVDAALQYFSFYGKVTRGGKPVHARLFETVSDPETGRYVAATARAPQGTQVVVACDDSFRYRMVLDEPPAENAAFDVELPENRVDVEVTDAATGLPIKDAIVAISALRDPQENSAHFSMQHGPTDEKGRRTIEPVLTDKIVSICAAHDDYAHRCAEDFTMKDTREKTVRIALEKVTKRYGRVVAGANFARAQLVWFAPDGEISEMIRKFETDGTFVYKKPHPAGEIAAFISAETPLYVFAQPHLPEGQLFTVRLPAARTRSFTVTVAESAARGGTVGLKIGDLFVPINALAWHLGPRHRVVNMGVSPGRSLHVVDILETAPISVVLIPTGAALPPGPYRDPMFWPDRNSLPTQVLGDRNAVVFD